MDDVIRFDDVHRSFGDKVVLSGLDLRVRPGEVFALLGRNGAGKTTAMNILLGFLEPTSGSSQLLGASSNALMPALRERVGLVTEGHKLYDWMRVRDVLEFEAGTRERFRRDYAERVVKRLDLPHRKRVTQLSRGMRAQLSLVIALAGDPEVLVMDDPALGLDVVMRREFLDAVIDLLGEEGRSVLFSSHVLSDVERVADRVGILHGGRLIVDAPLEDLRRRIEKRHLRCEGARPELPRNLPGLVRSRPLRDGWEVTLLDWGPDHAAAWRAVGGQLSEPFRPNLEDLFLDLTTDTERVSIARELELAR